ncbi:hypothetical protein J437_LFUL015310 [Ladona fulva]|uniref:G-patch domain-containing protein n=1 Tax=Ladona fulva TaxID=123851 RepID=A0A8K0P7M5_LADFU|nr:hypothetical protein J437_LFUL015310 [Ladona fulva]
MAMLAEPRRKEKWTLNPRGKFWSDDKNKFGQRMLEKMGWSEGKGLGASGQGATSHVAVKLKNDSKAIPGDKKFHIWYVSSYSKFTRGKDLTLYSKKDLDCILGIGVRKEEKPSTDDSVEDVGTMDTLYGVTTIVGGSVADYFKKKMTSLSRPYNVDNGLENDNESSMKMTRKRKLDKEDAELMEFSNNGRVVDGEGGDAESHSKRKKKRKKEKIKNIVDDEQNMLLKDVDQSTKNEGIESMTLDSAPCCLSEDLRIQGMSKKKKRSKDNFFEETLEEEIKVLEDDDSKVCEKKKKKKKIISLDDVMLASDTLIAKERPKKKGSRSGGGNVMQNTIEEGSQSVERSDKKSCLDGSICLEDSVEEVQIFQEEDVSEMGEIVTKEVKSNLCDDSVKPEGRPLKKKCKKKRRKKVDSEELMCIKEIYVVKDDDASEKVVQSTTADIKSKKRKEKGSSKDKHLESSDEILQIMEVSEDLENGAGSLLDGEVVDLKGKKRKEKKKKRLSKTNDDIDSKVDDNICDTLQSMPKKSKRSKEKKSLMTEMNSCDEIPTKNGVEIQKENVDEVSISDVSGRVQADSMVNTTADIGNEDPLVEQLSEKCKGVIFSDTAKQCGRNLEVSYYSCLKKKEKICEVSDVVHTLKIYPNICGIINVIRITKKLTNKPPDGLLAQRSNSATLGLPKLLHLPASFPGLISSEGRLARNSSVGSSLRDILTSPSFLTSCVMVPR